MWGNIISQLIKVDQEYKKWVNSIRERYQRSQIKAATAVNHEMMIFYWNLGKEIFEKMEDNQYGSRFYDVLNKLEDELKEMS